MKSICGGPGGSVVGLVSLSAGTFVLGGGGPERGGGSNERPLIVVQGGPSLVLCRWPPSHSSSGWSWWRWSRGRWEIREEERELGSWLFPTWQSETMALDSLQNSPRKSLPEWTLRRPHPHSVDLLKNRDLTTPLGPFDGNVGAFAELNGEHHFITTNADYVPALPLLQTPHAVYLRSNMRYGTDDPALWPQQYTPQFCHMPLMAKEGSRPEIDIMWWDPSRADFAVGSAITRGLGRLKAEAFSPLLSPINDLVARCTRLREENPELRVPLFGELIELIVRMLEQVQSLPTTFPKMVFLVTSLQRTFLELDALYHYMTVYKHQMNNCFAAPASQTALPQFLGAFTTDPGIVQQLSAARIPVWFVRPVIVFDRENILRVVPLSEPSFSLPDDDAHAERAPLALYSGNSTIDKIMAMRAASVHTPWYRDPFQTATTAARPRSPSPTPVASSAHSAPPALTRNNPVEKRHRPYPRNPPSSTRHQNQKGPAKTERDKFVLVTDEGMPPPVVSMAQALAKVNRNVVPYTSDDADKRYVLPEPALFVTSTPERRHIFLHHWTLLADGFIFTLAHQPQLLRPQEWRDVLEGRMTERGFPGSTTHRRSQGLQERIRPALAVCNVSTIEGLPVPVESLPEFSLEQTQEIVWGVAETGFRFEFCALDRRASGQERVDAVKACFAGDMLVGVPLKMGKRGWASAALEDRHRYVERTVALMLDWTTKSNHPNIICHVAERRILGVFRPRRRSADAPRPRYREGEGEGGGEI
ncbi:hypothetical protein B0H10DRAFT_2187282 [Mycena sp. CBHHK59/15]|nr:hypothetical protein B0H10DRAFT_2187282 [Mycena sp. CBHHK59/15]